MANLMEKRCDRLDRTAFYILVLFALVSNISTGATTVLSVLGILLVVLDSVRRRALPHLDRGLVRIILLFLAVWFFCNLFSREIAVSMRELWGTAYRFVPLFLPMLYLRSIKDLRVIVLAFAVSVFVNDMRAVYETFSSPNILFDRPTSFVHSSTFLGSHMLMAIPVFFFFAQKPYFSRGEKAALYALCFLSFIVLLLTQTRGAWIAFLLMGVLYFIMDRHHKKSIAAAGAAFVVFAVLLAILSPNFYQRVHSVTEKDYQSNSERTYMWQAALAMWKDHPIVGIGMDEFGYYYNALYIPPEAKERPKDPTKPRTGHGHPHNNLLKNLSEGGILGLGAFLMLHLYLFYRLAKLYRRDSKDENFSYALMGLLVFAGIHFEGITDTNANQLSIMRECYFLLGIAMTAGKVERLSRY